MVPRKHALFLQGWHATEAKDQRCTFRIRSTDHHGDRYPGTFIFKDVAYLKAASSGELTIIDIESYMLNDDNTTRVNTISPICQARNVKLIRGGWNEKFLSQITTFPNAKHDEFVDCLCYAIDQSLFSNQFSWGFL